MVIPSYEDWEGADAYYAKVEAESKAWQTKWPKHCKKCGGAGVLTWRQGHPYGSTIAYEELAEPCDCLMDGTCPRCGAATLNADPDQEIEHQVCNACGWQEDHPDVCPAF